MNKNYHEPRLINGFTFIEILISLMLLSLLLISIDATQLISLRESSQAYYFSVAVNQIENMLAQLQSSATPANIIEWQQQNAQVLPHGNGLVTSNRVSVAWGNKQAGTCDRIELGASGCVFENRKAQRSLN